VFSGLSVHLVLIQVEYDKTRWPAETSGRNTAQEKQMESLTITIHSEMTKVLICLCAFFSSHIADMVEEEPDEGR